MKVICINNGLMKNNLGQFYAAPELKESEIYTVVRDGECVIELFEVKTPFGFTGFTKSRFIPLSSIDETEFQREYKKELV